MTLEDKLVHLLYVMGKKSQNCLDKVFEFSSYELQRRFNTRLESLLGMLFLVCRLILMEFGSDPQKIGINDSIQFLEQNSVIHIELKAF